MTHTVLVHLVDKNGGRMLLARKKRGFGEGKLNGLGGKIEKGETPKEAAVREAKEEMLVDIERTDLVSVGIQSFHFKNHSEWNVNNEVFFAYRWKGEPKETEEMSSPTWYKYCDIPYAEMWADDILWLPQALAGFTLDGDFYFDTDGKEILNYKISGTERKEHHSKKEHTEVPEPHVIIPDDVNHIQYDEKPAEVKKEETAPAAVGEANDPRAKPPEAQAEEMPNLRKL